MHNNTQDHFCLPDLKLITLEEALHAHLMKDLGYERVLFVSEQRKLHFRDEQSLRLSKRTPKSTDKPVRSRKNRLSNQGPLGKTVHKPDKPEEKAPDANPHERDGIITWPIADSMLVRTIDPLMREVEHRTAVIFCDGLEFFTQLNQRNDRPSLDALRDMSTKVQNWMKLGAENQNICIFIFLPPQRVSSEYLFGYRSGCF